MPSATLSLPKLSPANLTLWAARAGLLLWAGFWMWFNVASSPGDTGGLWWHLSFGAILVGLGATSWFSPRVGGVLMIAAGMAAAWVFHQGAAYGLLAIPAAVIGVLLLVSSSSRR
jgi:hypothetical protein